MRRGLLLTMVATAAAVSGCVPRTKVSPAPTPPVAIPEYGVWPSGSDVRFRNLSHPSISPYWGRAKSEGEPYRLVNLLSAIRINWFPVVDAAFEDLGRYTRLPKQTVCGALKRAELFVGPGNSTERDWNLMLLPDDPRFVDTVALKRNASRVVAMRYDLSWAVENTGKYFNTEFWHRDADGLQLEAEVTAPRSLLESSHNPLPCVDGSCRFTSAANPQSLRKPDRMCVYGPWVQEALHGFRPEIHPAEAIYWWDEQGTLHLLMLQDASKRFDNSVSGKWWSVLGSAAAPQNQVPAEHWVQEAMVGEFVVPLPGTGAPRIELVGEQGLEPIGAGGYPTSGRIGENAVPVPGVDSRIQAAVLSPPGTGARYAVVRAQVRGAAPSAPLSNRGSYVYLRVRGARTPGGAFRP